MPDRSPGDAPVPERRWSRRLAWLAVIWVASVAAVALVAYGLRFVMGWAGLTR
jgi:hypothetical protein